MSANENFHNTANGAQSSNPFWDFSIAVYSQKSVAASCLALQDRHGLDVNIILYCCWLATQDTVLNPGQIKDLVLEVRETRKTIETLREMRRADGKKPSGLKPKILSLELDYERIEQDILFAATPRSSADAFEASEDTGFSNAAGSIANYFTLLAIHPGDADIRDVRSILLSSFSTRGTLNAAGKFNKQSERWRELWTV